MISEIGILNNEVTEDFSVLDVSGNAIDNINVLEFTVDIFNPNGNEVSSSVTHNFENITNGHYRLNFYPNAIGIWYVVVYHPVHFSIGKAANIKVYASESVNFGAIGIIDEEVTEDFSVVDYNGSLKNDVNLNDLQVELYSPTDNEISAVNTITLFNLGSGHYRAKYTPDLKGNWYLVIYHPILFPYGKASSIDVFDEPSVSSAGNQGGAYGLDQVGSPFTIQRRKIPNLKIRIVGEKDASSKKLQITLVGE